MTVRMRHTHGQTGERRSHHALKSSNLAVCANCKSAIMAHTACGNCGKYGKRDVLNVTKKAEKKEVKRKEKARAMSGAPASKEKK